MQQVLGRGCLNNAVCSRIQKLFRFGPFLSQHSVTRQQSACSSLLLFHTHQRLVSTQYSTLAKTDLGLRVYNIPGITQYQKALAFQREKRELLKSAKDNKRENAAAENDTLILLEHNPVYTLGKNSDVENCRFDINSHSEDYEVHIVERGGEVTYHGPGQIVGYTILDLDNHKKDLHWFLREVEEVIIRVLDTYGIIGSRHEAYTGVWVGDEKIAAIGLSASRW
eukprot:CAMPEP_0204894346 /NCGR_PEP_ID=MMETSP1349-20130617/33371_1 /ASSEMBLY_ACC=CAM_ASM_000710 /TAXON_ID=215587 /ORGANISM="Aplanochytrium stocchinoi, Strain GSBS06" /LENGTH=223 /DNA_ID=CAMNT_0052061507 /DNA_START=45 /DNA_END=713 /DNA_ORIENTATION=+